MKKHVALLACFTLSIVFLSTGVAAQSLSEPDITKPADGSTFTVGASFDLSATVKCSGPPGTTCESVTIEANIPSGLSTSDTNPKSCGDLNKGDSCSKSWTVKAESTGTYDLTVTADGGNVDSKTSSPVTVTVEETTDTTDEEELEEVSFTILRPREGDSFNRGEEMLVRVEASETTSLQAEIGVDQVQLRNDGEHGDEEPGDLIYGNWIEVPLFEEGTEELTVRITEEGKKGTERVAIKVTRDLNVSLDLATSYTKGDIMGINGTVRGVNGQPVANATVDMRLVKGAFEKDVSATTDSEGRFHAEHQLQFLYPDGTWTIRANATDPHGNTGFTKQGTEVVVPPEGDFYFVQYNTPLMDLSYSRGDTLQFSVEATEAGTAVRNASAAVRLPSGEEVELEETAPGTYTVSHRIGFSEPTGNYTVEAFVFKRINGTLHGGANQMTLNVQPATLTVELLSPEKDEVVAGKTIKIRTRVLYPDGTMVQNADVKAFSPGGEAIVLEEKEPGVYEANYEIPMSEEGQWFMDVEATDLHANSGEIREAVTVQPVTPFFLLLNYWYVVLAVLSPVLYFGYGHARRLVLERTLDHYESEMERLHEKKERIQERYYKEDIGTHATYEQEVTAVEGEMDDIRSRIKMLEDRLEEG